MTTPRKKKSSPAKRTESARVAPNAEVRQEFEEAAQLNSAKQGHLIDQFRDDHAISAVVSGSDIAVALEVTAAGKGCPEGEDPATDQNIVEDIGATAGLTYEKNEAIHSSSEKIKARDQSRWELDPASSEGYATRMKNEGDAPKK